MDYVFYMEALDCTGESGMIINFEDEYNEGFSVLPVPDIFFQRLPE